MGYRYSTTRLSFGYHMPETLHSPDRTRWSRIRVITPSGIIRESELGHSGGGLGERGGAEHEKGRSP
jgi:hypothetical protein